MAAGSAAAVVVAAHEPCKSVAETHLGTVREQDMRSIAACLDGGLIGLRRLFAHVVYRKVFDTADRCAGVGAVWHDSNVLRMQILSIDAKHRCLMRICRSSLQKKSTCSRDMRLRWYRIGFVDLVSG